MEQTKPTEVKEIKHFVRIANTDLIGKKAVLYAIQGIKGIGIGLANAICKVTKINPNTKIGELPEAQVVLLDKAVKAPGAHNIPSWMLNRQHDYETGTNKHLITSDLSFQIDNDIKLMKKIKCYKGIRHILGQPVRGQRTRSNFRKNKGKVMGVKSSAGAKKGGKT